MAGPTITQRIALEGADQIKQALSQIGKAGQEAFQQIRDAGEGVKLSAIEAAAKRVGVSVDEMRARLRLRQGVPRSGQLQRFRARPSQRGWDPVDMLTAV